MKKVIGILAVMVMTIGFYSCETENIAEEEQLVVNSFTDDDNACEGRKCNN